MKKLNFKKGLFRIWIIVSVIWFIIIFFGMVVYIPNIFKDFSGSLLYFFIFGLVPPLLVLLLWPVSKWIIKLINWAKEGFETNKK
tara:strand:- start:60 stop:314 length:255 start_codon:yes stop_codon:yes gene_type:complete